MSYQASTVLGYQLLLDLRFILPITSRLDRYFSMYIVRKIALEYVYHLLNNIDKLWYELNDTMFSFSNKRRSQLRCLFRLDLRSCTTKHRITWRNVHSSGRFIFIAKGPHTSPQSCLLNLHTWMVATHTLPIKRLSWKRCESRVKGWSIPFSIPKRF